MRLSDTLRAVASQIVEPPKFALSEIEGGLNRWTQHWLGVYSLELQSSKSCAGVD